MGSIIKTISLSLLLFLGIGSLTFGAGDPALTGTWQYRGSEGIINLVFQSDNVLVFDGEPIQYSLVQGAIRIQDDGEIVDYPYSFQGQTLVITFPDGYQMPFARVSGEISPSSPSVQSVPGQGSVDSNELARQIAGIWWGYTGSTERKIGLCPGGIYHDYTESSYSGGSSDSLGNPSMSWGAAGQSGGAGTWRIQGDYQQGLIFVQYNNGNQTTIQYQQCGETGCLLFNGNKLCRAGRCE
ncbi:MAG: hypothetical protein JW932_02310 [Deltaproteobacteria bacterium]|nr:hypothetical protein [Deltaproteobacteria bacterium]